MPLDESFVLVLDDFEDGQESKPSPVEGKESRTPEKAESQPQDSGTEAAPVETEQPSQAETKARSSGWVNREEWLSQGKTEQDWVPAHQFNVRGELMERISHQSKIIRNLETKQGRLEDALQTLGKHNAKLAEETKKETLEKLYQDRAHAQGEGLYDRVAQTDQMIDEVRNTVIEEDIFKETPTPTQQEVDPQLKASFERFRSAPENSWHGQDKAMTATFSAFVEDIYTENPYVPLDKIFQMASNQVQKEFPHKFGNPNRTRRPMVAEPSGDGDTRARGSGRKFTIADLNPEQRQAAETFQRMGTMSVDKYIDQLVQFGELK
jgi:hypothetical protein